MANIVLFAVMALLIALEAVHTWERCKWNTERQQLLDRIQSHSLGEYKAYAKPAAKEPDKEPEQPIVWL